MDDITKKILEENCILEVKRNNRKIYTKSRIKAIYPLS